jgi:hypothetical protein
LVDCAPSVDGLPYAEGELGVCPVSCACWPTAVAADPNGITNNTISQPAILPLVHSKMFIVPPDPAR